MISELKQIASKLLNSRSQTWDMSGEAMSLLNYALDFVKLNSRDRMTISAMVEEYYRHHDRYKPTQWLVSAERMQAIYAVSKKLSSPLPSDVRDVINTLKNHGRYSSFREDTSFNMAIGLLEYLHNYLENNQVIVNTIEDDAV